MRIFVFQNYSSIACWIVYSEAFPMASFYTLDQSINDDFLSLHLKIHLLDLSKVDTFISGAVKLKKDDSDSFEEYINEFKRVYNTQDSSRKFINVEKDTYNGVTIFKITYTRDIIALDKTNEKTDSLNYFLLLIPKAKNATRNNVFAATFYEAHEVIRPYVEYNFPIKIIKRVGSPDKITRTEGCYILKGFTKARYDNPNRALLSRVSYLVENLICEIDKRKKCGDELFDFLKKIPTYSDSPSGGSDDNDEFLPPPRKKQKFEESFLIKITRAGSVIIPKRLKFTDCITIVQLFNTFLSDSEPMIESFDFLQFLIISEKNKETLDDALINDIFKKHTDNIPQSVYVKLSEYSEDFHILNKCAIRFPGEDKFKRIGSVAPKIDQIIQEIDSKEIETFKERMKNGMLRLNYQNHQECDRIIDYIEGHFLYEDQDYFKVSTMWYQTDSDPKSESLYSVHKKFEITMDKLFTKEGTLFLPWKVRIPFSQEELQKYLCCDQLYTEKLMDSLKNTKVSYIGEGEIIQTELIGEILEDKEIKIYKEKIESALKELQRLDCDISLEEFEIQINKISEDTMETNHLNRIWQALIKKRPILYEKNKKTWVGNPFPYPLRDKVEHEGNYEKLRDVLTKACDHQDEGDYVRSYLNHDQLKDHTYLVFDQILINNIEPCDILSYAKDKLHLYQVKEKFNKDTRTACSQIQESAEFILGDLPSNVNNNFLESMWEMANKEKGAMWRRQLKEKMKNIDKESFVNRFSQNNIVFFYAFRTPYGFKTSSDRENITDRKIREACKTSGFIDECGFLTNKFFNTNKRNFQSGLRSCSKSITTKECNKTFDIMKKRKFSNSTAAKLAVIKLGEIFDTFPRKFKLNICAIPIPERE